MALADNEAKAAQLTKGIEAICRDLDKDLARVRTILENTRLFSGEVFRDIEDNSVPLLDDALKRLVRNERDTKFIARTILAYAETNEEWAHALREWVRLQGYED